MSISNNQPPCTRRLVHSLARERTSGPMWLAIKEVSFVHVAVGHAVDALATTTIIDELTVVHVAVAGSVDSAALAGVMHKLADIFVAVGIDQCSHYIVVIIIARQRVSIFGRKEEMEEIEAEILE